MRRRHLHAGLALALLGAQATTPALAGELLVGNKSADTLWRLSLADGRKLGEAPTAPGPHEIAVSPDGQLAVVSEYGRQAPGNTLGVYATADGRLLRRIDLGTHTRPHGMRFDADGRRLLVTTEGSDALLVVGSSLMVYSGYRFAVRARDAGLPLAILTSGTTRADALATLKLDADSGATLANALNLMGIESESSVA